MKQLRITLKIILTGILAAVLTGCAVVEDTWEGLTGEDTSPSASAQNTSNILVKVEIESDSNTSGEVEIKIEAAQDSLSYSQDTVELPFSKEFEVPSDSFFPFRNSYVEVESHPDANWVECRLIMNNEVVASHRSEGSGARAVCERGLQLGPS